MTPAPVSSRLVVFAASMWLGLEFPRNMLYDSISSSKANFMHFWIMETNFINRGSVNILNDTKASFKKDSQFMKPARCSTLQCRSPVWQRDLWMMERVIYCIVSWAANFDFNYMFRTADGADIAESTAGIKGVRQSSFLLAGRRPTAVRVQHKFHEDDDTNWILI